MRKGKGRNGEGREEREEVVGVKRQGEHLILDFKELVYLIEVVPKSYSSSHVQYRKHRRHVLMYILKRGIFG